MVGEDKGEGDGGIKAAGRGAEVRGIGQQVTNTFTSGYGLWVMGESIIPLNALLTSKKSCEGVCGV